MLSVVVFGAVCELSDDDPNARNEPTVYFNHPPAPERAEIPAPDTTETHRGRFRGHFTTVDQAPRWQRRLEARRERRRNQAGVSFTEFADLSDGRRAIMRNDRGFSWSMSDQSDPWDGTTRESLADKVRDYLAAEEEECCPIPPESVIEHLQRVYDLEVDAASVQAALQLPRRIEFGTGLLETLSR